LKVRTSSPARHASLRKFTWLSTVIVACLLALLLVGGLLSAQTRTTTKKTALQKKTTQAKARKAAVDSMARADSLQKALREKTIADSIRQVEDSLKVAAADTVHRFIWRKVENSAFRVGERLEFDISYGFVTAGEAILSIPAHDSVGGRKAYRVEVAVNSLPSFSWIYKVEDRYLTFIDTESLASLRFEQHIREGSYTRDFVAEFDQIHNIARTTEGEYQVPAYVHDIMSAFFFVRALDLRGRQPGDTVTLFNFYKNKSYELVVKVLGRQELEVEAGTFKTIVLEPLVREGGLFKSEGRIVVWLTDDEAKMPIRVNTKIVIGSIDTELRAYSGVRAPLTSKIR
jgi:hypothetical protein